jgi:hypothetical protein
MRKIREVLRLKFEVGLSARQIAVSLQVGRATVGDYLNRFAANGLTWPTALSDVELERSLFPPAPTVPSEQLPMPDWAWAHAELRRPGVTLALLWQEYRLSHPAPEQTAQRRAAGSPVPACAGTGRMQLQKPRVDLAPRVGTATAGPAEPAAAARRAHQPARPRLLPLT